MSYRVKLRERKKNKRAMLSLYLEFMPPYVAPNGECVRYEKSKEEFIIHFKHKYSDSCPYPPAWMIAEILPLGNLCHIFMNLMSPRAKKKVAKYFGLQEPSFASWMLVLGNLRNMCCHHSRTRNRELAINTANPQVTAFPWIDISKTNPKRIILPHLHDSIFIVYGFAQQ